MSSGTCANMGYLDRVSETRKGSNPIVEMSLITSFIALSISSQRVEYPLRSYGGRTQVDERLHTSLGSGEQCHPIRSSRDVCVYINLTNVRLPSDESGKQIKLDH